MKFVAVIFLALISLTPAMAAPPEVKDFCWAQAAQIRSTGEVIGNTSSNAPISIL
jgi:hypothetical protein